MGAYGKKRKENPHAHVSGGNYQQLINVEKIALL